MKILITVLLLLPLLNDAHARTPQNCIEMMRLHYLWLDQGRLELAKRQLKTATKACIKIINNKKQFIKLEALVLADKKLIKTYESLVDKDLEFTYISP